MKRLYPQNMVFIHSDGDLVGHRYRNDPWRRAARTSWLLHINNAIHGMTGGQMGPRPLSGMKTPDDSTAARSAPNGYPYKIVFADDGPSDGATLHHAAERMRLRRANAQCKRRSARRLENSDGRQRFFARGGRLDLQQRVETRPWLRNQWLAENMLPFYPLGDIKRRRVNAMKETLIIAGFGGQGVLSRWERFWLTPG